MNKKLALSFLATAWLNCRSLARMATAKPSVRWKEYLFSFSGRRLETLISGTCSTNRGVKIQVHKRIVRYVKPRLVHDTGHIDPEAFALRTLDDGTDETGLSVNCIDEFLGDTEEKLRAVAQHIRLKVTKNGRFAELTVEQLIILLGEEGIEATVTHDPLEADQDAGLAADPSHAQIYGLPPPSCDRATEVGEILVDAAQVHLPPV